MAVVDFARGPDEVFGPLKAVLESISVLHAQYQVYFFFRSVQGPPLTIASPEYRQCQGQDRNPLLTHYLAGGAS